MAPQYKVHYFKGRNRGEPIRLILKYAGVEFEDVRYDYKDDEWFNNVKKTMPWGVLPVLEVDGVKMGQMKAIARFLARKFDLVGETELDSFRCDELGDVYADFTAEAYRAFYAEKDEVKKKKVREESIPRNAKWIEEILEKNGTGFLVGKKLTWADIFWASIAQDVEDFFDVDLSAYKKLKEHQKMVLGQPGIKEWIAVRPPTPF